MKPAALLILLFLSCPACLMADYEPGDLVTWNLSDSIPHIGIVSDRKTEEGTPLIIHNVGAGTQEEDFLFSHTITGHYRPVLAERKQKAQP